jgi:hypothetical protein
MKNPFLTWKKPTMLLFLLGVGVVGLFVFIGTKYTPGTLHSANGVVTRKFTDCVGGEEMDKSGRISKITEISCDGGSTITIDGNTSFITSTGNVLQNTSYSVDVSSIAVGDTVVVKYAQDANGYRTLGCKGCSVTKK